MLPGVPARENVTPDMHHRVRRVQGSSVAPKDGALWVSLVMYATSSAPEPGATLTVEGNGGLSALSIPGTGTA